MFKRNLLALGALALPGVVLSAPSDRAELDQIRTEMQALKESYEARVQALEKRLQEVESTQASASSSAPTPASSSQVSAAAFNPAISLILQGSYTHAPDQPRAVPGYLAPDAIGPVDRGFSLAETELDLAANIDPYFFGAASLSLAPEGEIGIEEAYFQTLGLGKGFTVKGGRFFSGIGYLNEFHQHAWDFFDVPLAYQVLLGTEAGGNHGEDGVQLRWLAPTDTFLEFGAELGRGKDFPASDRNQNGVGSKALFAHLGGDVGVSHSYRLGLSWLDADPRDRSSPAFDLHDTDVTNLFSGSSQLWIGDFVYKYSPNGDPSYRNFKLQGEVLWRDEDGKLTYDSDDVSAGTHTERYSSDQLGMYLQGIYQFHPRWRTGLRGEWLHSEHLRLGSNAGDLPDADHDPIKYSAMLDYNPSEFSRIRLQVSQQRLLDDETNNQATLQYIYSLGTHGAHQF